MRRGEVKGELPGGGGRTWGTVGVRLAGLSIAARRGGCGAVCRGKRSWGL